MTGQEDMALTPSGLETRQFYDGNWQTAGTPMPVRDKFDGTEVATVATASRQAVRAAVAACARAFEAGVPTPHERAEILHEAARRLIAERARFEAVYLAETGFTRSDAAGEVSRTIETLKVAAEEARRFDASETIPLSGAPGQAGRLGFLLRVPLGVVAAITPFNAPLNTVVHKLAPAIAAGNAIVLKPSTHTPLCGALLTRLLLDAGWPAGLIALLHGGAEVGEQLLAEPAIRFYTFTGSTAVGRAIQQAAGLRRTQLELGSIAFTVLDADADLERALPAVRNASFRKAGQVCTSIQILLVHNSLRADVTARLADLARETPYGDPRDDRTLTGPMITEHAAARAEAIIGEARQAGATLEAGGHREGAVLAPTVLSDVPEDSRVLTEEIFAPVVSVVGFDDFGEAIDRVNATPYGLATGVFTQDIGRALQAARRLRVGGVHINNTCSSRVDLMPYGGTKESGFGQEGPRYAMREMSEERLVTITP